MKKLINWIIQERRLNRSLRKLKTELRRMQKLQKTQLEIKGADLLRALREHPQSTGAAHE